MVDIKNIQKQIEAKNTQDNTNRNLYLRSLGEPASSQFGWSNPIDANGVPVLARKNSKNGDPNLKTPTEIANDIATTKSSYMAGNIQRVFSDDVSEEVKENYKQYDRLSHTPTLYVELANDDAFWGSAYTLTYLVGEGTNRKPMTRKYHSWNGYIKYDEELFLPEYGCIYGTVGKKDNRCTSGSRQDCFIEVYDNTTMYRYEAKSFDGDFKEVDKKPHGFTQVPVIEWINNKQLRGDAEKAVALIDALEAILADNASEGAAFSNAYMLLQNMGKLDDEKKKAMKNTGIIMANSVTGENPKAEFIIKNINPEFVRMLLEELRTAAYESAQSLDPRTLKGMKEMRKAQADNMYAPLDKTSKNTERMWNESLEYLDRVLKSFWTTLASPSVADYNTYDIDYKFNYARPEDSLTDLKDIKDAGGNLPQYVIFMRGMNVDEKTAIKWAEESNDELTESVFN